MESFCKYGCAEAKLIIKFKPFAIPSDPYKRNTFHLSAYCGVCKKWQKHLKQTPQLLEQVEGVTLLTLKS